MPKKSNGPLVKLRKELESIMLEVKKYGNEGLNEAADLVKKNLEDATPVRTGTTKQDWVNVKNYNLVKYIYNENLSKSGIPVLNLLEFGSKGKPFAIATFRQSFSQIEQKIISNLNKVK